MEIPSNLITQFYKKNENNLTIIQIEGKFTESFVAAMDKLTVRYLYKHHNYTIESAPNGLQYQTILNCSIPLDLSNTKAIGRMDYTLSELERISALKIQTEFRANRTGTFNVAYSLYNFTSQSWVLCNWTGADSWASGKNTFPELYGYWNYSYRSSNSLFALSNAEYRPDAMYVMMRGTYDQAKEVRLDHEHETTLAHLINPATKTVLLQINVTDTANPFNLSIDTLGIVGMAWGLAPGKYDESYAYDCVEQQFSVDQLLNLQVQDFQVINGTGDNALDVLAITGYHSTSSNPPYMCGSSLRLFDFKNNEVSTKWTTNTFKLPSYKVRAQILNTTSVTNSWILTGGFQNASNRYYYVSKIVEDAHWDPEIYRFSNFSDAFVAFDFGSTTLPSHLDADTYRDTLDNEYLFPTTIQIKTNGTKGIVTFQKLTPPAGAYVNIYGEIQILDATTFNLLGGIPCFVVTSGVKIAQVLSYAKILLAHDDFDGDGFLDHVGIYPGYSSEPFSPSGISTYLRVYSGNVGGTGTTKLLKEKQFSSMSYEYSSSSNNMPCTSIGDTDGDGAAELAVGLEVSSYGSTKGSSIFTINIKKNTEKESIYTPYVSLSSWAPIQKRFYSWMASMDVSSSQKTSAVFVQRTSYKTQLSGGYQISDAAEIIDVQNQTSLLRVRVEADAIFRVHDMNKDGEREYLLSSGGILYCYNSAFKVTLSNIVNGETRPTNEFNVEWTSTATQPVYELVVDDMGYGTTSNTRAHVSLGSGSRHLEVMLYDSSGIFIAIDDATITIPPNITMPLITIFFISGMVVAFIWRKRRRAGWRRRNSYDLEKTASHTTLGNPTKATKDENVSKLNAKGGLFGGN